VPVWNFVRRSFYQDSVTLMQVAVRLRALAGVEDALASFAERQNLVDYDGFAALDRRYAEPSPERQ